MSNLRQFVFFVPLGILFTLGFLLPVGHLFIEGLALKTDWVDWLFWHYLKFTYIQAFLSAFFSGIFGIIAAFIYVEQEFYWKKMFWNLSLMSFGLPTLLVALCVVSFWQYFGVDWAYGWSGILLAHTFLNFPLFLRSVGTALLEIDRSEELAALSLGASRFRCFYEITLPKVMPAIRTAFFLSVLFCSMSFMIVLLLGGNPYFTTLEVAIFQAVKVNFKLALSVRLALVQCAISFAIYFCFLTDRQRFLGRSTLFVPLYRFRGKGLNRLLMIVFALAFLLLVVGPLGTFILSGMNGFKTLDTTDVYLALRNSIELALVVATLTLVFALFAIKVENCSRGGILGKVIATFCILPISLSSIVVSVAFMRMYPTLFTSWRGTLWGPIFIQSLLALPLAYRIIREGYARIPENILDAAASLGSSSWRRFCHIEIPLLKSSLCLAFALVAGFSLGEVGSMLLFLSDEIKTIPVMIYQLMASYQFDSAYAMGNILLILMVGVYILIGKLDKQ